MKTQLNRRAFLAGACCVAASPLVTPVSFAAMPGDNRLVTIVLRGGLDGLALVQPYGDPALRRLRPKLALGADDGLIDLDGFFGLHPAAADLMPLWRAGELAFVHAASTPYRDGRSHFDGQDILESGGAAHREQTGWLNRAIGVIPRPADRRAIDVTTTAELILSGKSPVDVWSAQADLVLAQDELAFFTRLYKNDPPFAAALQEATETDLLSDTVRGTQGKQKGGVAAIAKFAAGMLSEEHRIASFSINGWDTHFVQARIFKRPVTDLATAIVTLKANLSAAVWRKTMIIAVTEFGRTARENGSEGTDHGTGGVAILAGGAVAGGKVYRDWPSLAEGDLLDDRDLRPTTDLRQLAAGMLYQQFNISVRDIETSVFPGLSFDKRASFLRG
nr:DUF1501 domain-containing protein [uncultured Shinella sp.]